MSKITLSWPDRFALMDHFSPSDDQVCTTFGLSVDELSTARSLRAAGTFKASATLDVGKYANVFSPTGGQTVATSVMPADKPTKGGGMTTFTRPESASKKVKVPQKRGRKGDKITTALMAVPTSQVPVETFIAEHGVSLAVLRQSKRFIARLPADQAKAIGHINVRQDKTTKVLQIWREVPTA